MNLSVCYLTNRQDPYFQWFVESLRLQDPDLFDRMPIIVVDHLAETEGRKQVFENIARRPLVHIEPKPNVWSGHHRLPRQHWFSAANSRNTGLCMTRTEWIAFVDDLSVIMPGWLNCIRDAMNGKYVALGSYRKAFGMVVEGGVLKSFERESVDTRVKQTIQDVSKCDGGWLYGCSLAGAIEDFLRVGGFPEFCDGLGSEDCCMGKMMQNAHCDLRYDRRMVTVESEEGHGQPGGFEKADKGPLGTEADKSHRAIQMATRTSYFENYYPGGMAALREKVLAGQPFPIPTGPTHDWYDSRPIKDMFMKDGKLV